MRYPVQLEGFEGQAIEVQSGTLFTGPKLLVNGQPAPAARASRAMTLRRNDGREVVAAWKPQFLGLDTPQLLVEGKTISLVEPLKWYQWLWSALPLALAFLGGALGAVAGFVAMAINIRIFRSSLNGILKFVVTAAVSLGALVAYFIAAALFLNLVAR
jgi:hypothetical protein